MVRGYALFDLRFCHQRSYLHVINGSASPRSTRVRAPPVDSSWRGRLLRRTQRLCAVRHVVVCYKVSFFSGLENVGGWLKVTPMLARPNWQLDSGACKNGKGRGTRKTGTELVVGLQCHTGQVRG